MAGATAELDGTFCVQCEGRWVGVMPRGFLWEWAFGICKAYVVMRHLYGYCPRCLQDMELEARLRDRELSELDYDVMVG